MKRFYIYFKCRFFNFPIMCLNVSFDKFQHVQGVIAFSCKLVNVFGPR